MSVVREEFGPTLPELLGPRLHVPVRTIWRVLAAAGVVVVLVLAWLVFLRGTPGQAGVVVREPVTFNLIHTDALHRVAPRVGETLRLQTTRRAAAVLRRAPAAPGALQGRRERGPDAALGAPHPADGAPSTRASCGAATGA